MPQLEIGTFLPQIFWLSIIFSVLYLALSFYVAPNIESMINNRQHVIEDDILKAQEYNDKIKAIEYYQESLMSEADSLVEEMHEQEMKIFDELFKTQKSSIMAKISKQEELVEHDIAKYIRLFQKEEKEYQIALAAAIIYKITGKKADHKLLKQYS